MKRQQLPEFFNILCRDTAIPYLWIKHLLAPGYLHAKQELNFRKAAERLHITQPPLSQSIKKLEDTLDVTLFERNTRGVHLTKAGEAFLEESLKILSAAHRSVNVARQAAHGEAGTLRLGYSASAIFYKTLTSALADLLADRPMLNLELHEGNALFHIASLKAGKLDAAILRADLDEDALSGLSVSRLGNEPLFVILNPAHRLQERSSIDFRELAGERFLLQPAPLRISEDAYVRYLNERGYAAGTVKGYVNCVAHFGHWLKT